MMWLVENWSLLVIIIAAVIVIAMTINHFTSLPTEEQIANIKQWLLYAVVEAEKELGGGTGKIKLRQVYDLFLTKFPWAARVVPFTLFSIWVDEVLIEMKRLLESNNTIASYVNEAEAWENK